MITAILAFFCGILFFQYLPVLLGAEQVVAICFFGILLVIGCLCLEIKYKKDNFSASGYRRPILGDFERKNSSECSHMCIYAPLPLRFFISKLPQPRTSLPREISAWIITKKVHFYLKLIIIFLLGFLYSLLLAKWYGRWDLPKDLVGKNIIVTGYVSSLPVNKMEYSKFRFTTETVARSPQQTYLLLSWYGKERLHVAAGEKWQLLVKLKRPHGMLNPGGFDYEKYLWQQHVRATGYVTTSAANKQIVLANLSARHIILSWRQKIADKINCVLQQQPLLSMINALVLGDQSGINKEQWSIFRNTGTSYLMAIAGLHICLAAGVVFVLVQFLWCRSQRLALWLPTKKASALFGLIAAIIYSLLSGFSIPTQRALIMLTMFTLGLLLQRNTNVWHVLCMALLAILLFDPLSVLSIGFWLSFIAVVIIFYVTSGRLQLSHVYWRKYIRMQGAITLGLAPFTLLFFSQVSIATFVANIFALPGVCLVVVPLSLLGSLLLLLCVGFGKYILLLAEKIMELVWYGLQWLSLYPQFNWQHSVFAWWQVALAIVGLFLLLAPRGVYGKCAGIIWFCPLLFCVPPQPRFGEIWFSMLDVGEGLATIIQTQQHILIYDTGPKFADSDVGENIVVPFLQHVGVTHIDTMVISHGDDDHSGGAASILRLMTVDKIITSIPEKFPQVLAQNCYAGQIWRWDGINFRMLYPPQGEPYGGNKSSCVMRVDNGKQSILLPGDIESGQEKKLLQQVDNGLLESTILVAPHHGSATSSTPDFVSAVNARYVLFSAGYTNRFHFPSAEVLMRYQQQGTKILQTSNNGAISFKITSGQNSLDPILYRNIVKHYWENPM